ncbi:MAG: nitroreductase family protein [Anaerolineae bacterium]|nr:nitroreductase family protein [Anaerolineae bacterium]
MLKELIHKNRSYRRFHETMPLDRETLIELVDLARHSASGSNKQPLKFILSADCDTNARVFPCLRWAGYLKNWAGPQPGERPAAYIIILGDTAISKDAGVDHGIAAQSIMLGAAERGYGGCMLGSIDRARLRTELAIPERYDILLVLALGKPAETVVIDPVGPDGDIKYWRDDEDVHHVPKRSLDTLILA